MIRLTTTPNRMIDQTLTRRPGARPPRVKQHYWKPVGSNGHT